MNNDDKLAFFQAISDSGIIPPKSIKADDKIHHFSSNGVKKDTAGWYVLRNNSLFYYGCFGCHRLEIKDHWSSVKSYSTKTKKIEETVFKQMYVKEKKYREQKNLEAKSEAKNIWDNAQPADPEHGYLNKKCIKAHDIKQTQLKGVDVLIIPMRDIDGELNSIQYIYPGQRKMNKQFLKNGRTSGLFCTLGSPTGTRIICEGYATGASIHEATGHCVHVAFTVGNLKNVADVIRKKHQEVDLVIAADDDFQTEGNPGLTKATQVAKDYQAMLAVPRWINDRKEKDTDFNDLMIAEGLVAVRNCFETAVSNTKSMVDEKAEKINNQEKIKEDDKNSVSTQLLNMAQENCEFFVDQNRDPYARVPVINHHENYRLDSNIFYEWLGKTYWETENQVPYEASMRSAIATLSGIAKFKEDQKQVFMRVGKHEDSIFLDLANNDWNCIEITKHGWKVLDKSPVTFVRTPNMRPLPKPGETNDIERLWNYVNVAQEERLLLLSWLVEFFRRDTHDPLLELTGEQGSGKSITHNNIRELIDPNKVNLRSAPQKIDELFIPAAHSLLVSIENVSYLSDPMQDRMCSLGTGGGFATRTLYSTSEETAVELQRPIIVNGIVGVVTRPDLLDRTLILELPQLIERKTSKELKDEFEKDLPTILVGLLDLLSKVLNLLPSIKISPKQLPRMGDFAHCGEAVYQVYGNEPGKFLSDFKENRLKGIRRTLDTSIVGTALSSYLEFNKDSFEGTIKTLLHELEPHKPEGESWFKSPRALGDQLRRYGPALRLTGIDVKVDSKAKSDGYHVRVSSINN